MSAANKAAKGEHLMDVILSKTTRRQEKTWALAKLVKLLMSFDHTSSKAPSQVSIATNTTIMMLTCMVMVITGLLPTLKQEQNNA